MKFLDGRHYEGEWRNDQRSGHGTMTWSDGSWYDGHFAFGVRHGYGVMISISSRLYTCYRGYKHRAISGDIMEDPRGTRYDG